MMDRLKQLLGLQALPKDLSYEQARDVLEEQNLKARKELASRKDAAPEMLYYLTGDAVPDVRRAVAANPSTPIKASEKLANDPEEDVRAELARRIARLVPGADETMQSDLHHRVIALLEKLAEDRLPRVRAIISEEIKSSQTVPKHLVMKLAKDTELSVCAPVLEYSPLLSDADLMELIAGSAVAGVSEAVAKRAHLSDDVADSIAKTLDVAAVTKLLSNPNAQIREDTLDQIINMAVEEEMLHEPLVLRPSLSMRAVRRIASFVARALLEELLEKSDLDDGTRKQVQKKVLERVEKEDVDAPKQNVKLATIRKLYEEGKLNDKAVAKLTGAGGKEAVALALALLIKEPVQKVTKVLESKSPEAITSLCWLAKVSMRTAHEVQKTFHVPYDKLLLPRGGFDYPMDEKKIVWQLEFLGFTKD